MYREEESGSIYHNSADVGKMCISGKNDFLYIWIHEYKKIYSFVTQKCVFKTTTSKICQ